jgi:hypothetical protein
VLSPDDESEELLDCEPESVEDWDPEGDALELFEPVLDPPPEERNEWEEWPGNALATAAERIPPARRPPAARYRVLRPTRSRPRSRDALEGM